MIVTKKFSFDLDTRGISPLMYAVQGDVNTRKVEIFLFSNGTAWEIPDGTVVAVAYRKPDGTGGLYDKLPSGESASEVSGNVVTVMLAPQVLTCAGNVVASIVFYSQDMADTLATFSFQIHVEKNPGAGQQISNNYYTLQNLEQVNTAYNDLLERVESLEKGGSGITSEEKTLILTLFRNAAYTSAEMADTLAQLEALWNASGDSGEEEPDDPVTPEKTLTSISAVYSGGDVAVGTALADLTGIVVTAHYSDGTSEVVTGHTLSGEIAEGENTITVTYQDKTATFTVTGVAESGGEIENNGWVDGQAYTIEWTDGYYADATTGADTAYNNYSVSNYLPCHGASAVIMGTTLRQNYGVFFYDEEKNYLDNLGANFGSTPVPVPLSAYYVRCNDNVAASDIPDTSTLTPVVFDKLDESTVYETGKYYSMEWEYGKTLNKDTGAEGASTNATNNVSAYALCMGASTVIFAEKARALVCFYDADKVFISSDFTGTSTATVNIPENAVYFRYDTYGYTNEHNVWVQFA